jgi:hypothetical protein
MGFVKDETGENTEDAIDETTVSGLPQEVEDEIIAGLDEYDWDREEMTTREVLYTEPQRRRDEFLRHYISLLEERKSSGIV